MRQRKGRDDNDIVNLSHSVFSLKKWRHKIKFGMPLMVRLSQNWTSSLSASLDENRYTRLLCTILLPSAQKIAALSPLWWQNTLGNTWLRNSSFNTQSDISIYFSPIHSKIPKGEALFNGWKYFEYYPPCPPKEKKKKREVVRKRISLHSESSNHLLRCFKHCICLTSVKLCEFISGEVLDSSFH